MTSDTAPSMTETKTAESSTSSLPPKEAVVMMANDVEAVQEQPVEWKAQKQEYLVMVTLAVVSLMVALDATILVPILPTLAKDLNGTATDAFWVGTSYLLACAVFQPFIAALSDIFGRRELLLPSLLFFTVGSILCAVAHSFTALLAGRCVQGIGGGGVITLAQVITADIIPLRQRPKWFSLVLAAWALGTVLGPLIGGVFVEKATWRWAFWLNLPFCGIGLVAALLFVQLKTAKTSLKEKLLRVDWLGGFLFIASLTSFLVAISWGGVHFSWSGYQTLVPLIVGATGLGATVVWEEFGAREPFLRRSLFSEGSAIAAYTCAFLQGLVLFCSLYYAPFYLMAVKFKSPIAAGVDLLPTTCALLPGSAVVSMLITRLGHFRCFIWTGWTIATVGAGLLILLGEHTRTAVWAVAFAVFGLGSGMVLSALNFGIQAIVRTEDCARAASMYAFMRTLGMTVGVAVGGSVFQNTMARRLAELALPLDIARNAEGYVAVLSTLAEADPLRVGVLQAYVRGFHGVFEVLTAVSGVGLLASVFIKHHTMDKVLESDYTLDRR